MIGVETDNVGPNAGQVGTHHLETWACRIVENLENVILTDKEAG
jgi:hypothetical protein